MRDMFRGYYKPTSDELDRIWSEGLIVFDANVLLDIYRLRPSTTSKLLEVVDKARERIWIPHQAALEFQRNRLDVIDAQRQHAYHEVGAALTNALKSVEGAFARFSNHPFLDRDAAIERLAGTVDEIQKQLDQQQKDHPDHSQNDAAFEHLTIALTGRVGEPYSQQRLSEIYKEGEKRYATKIPPGYSDAKKPGPEKFGDLVLWFQIIEKAKEAKKPVLFVTRDQKEDWWREHGGKRFGPRPE